MKAQYYLLTLDSHETIGPFRTDRIARAYAMLTERKSYTILEDTEPRHAYAPSWKAVVINAERLQ